MSFPVHQLKKTGVGKAIRMKQLSPKRRKKPSISESISFVIKGKLSMPVKSMITREMKYRRTSRRGAKKDVEECKVENKVQIGCGMKVESEVTAKKKSGKQAKTVGGSVKNSQKVKAEENVQKAVKRNQYRSKQKISLKADTEVVTGKRSTRKLKSESPIKTEKVNSKRTIPKILRESSRTTNGKNIKRLSPNVNTAKKLKGTPKKEKIKETTKLRKVYKKKEDESNCVKPKEEPTAFYDSPTSEPDQTLDILPAIIKKEVKEEDVIQDNVKLETKKKPGRKANNTNKLKYKPKTAVPVKKPIFRKNKTKVNETKNSKKPKMKLLQLLNTPKPHRVASLNAKAKVHCLYENECRNAILDNLEAIKSETSSDNSMSSKDHDDIPTRTLRSVPGLRAVGKHWDMDDGTFSSSDESSYDAAEKAIARKPKAISGNSNDENKSSTETTGKKRRRNRTTEVTMDLKDMVVSKRLASLNAAAILAASYSMERRCLRSPKCEDTDDESEDGSKKHKDKKKSSEDTVKTDDDSNIIEVCATPNKKVAVILNQDTDVTITGVYLNSTTRSTHHEGYCSIAGMQYRISATSHTQTAATAVATETILQPSGNGAGQDNVSRK